MSLIPTLGAPVIRVNVDPIRSQQLKIVYIENRIYFDFKGGRCFWLSKDDFFDFFEDLRTVNRHRRNSDEDLTVKGPRWLIVYSDFGTDAIPYNALISIDNCAFFTDIDYIAVNLSLIGGDLV